MDNRTKGIRLLIAGGLFALAGLNTWRLSGGETMINVLAGSFLLGGIGSLAAGGYFMAQD